MHPGLDQNKHGQQVKGDDSPTILCPCENPHVENLVSSSGPQMMAGTQRQAERVGAVHSGEEKDPGTIYISLPVPKEV